MAATDAERAQRDAGVTKSVVDAFHTLFYYSPGAWSATWLGVPILQNPMDMWALQEVIVESKPELIIETGTAYGGSALFYASVFGGEVVSVDLQEQFKPRYTQPRITFLKGNSVDPNVVTRVSELARGKRTMVVLDGDHSAATVLKELEAYAPLVSDRCYLVVCDTNIGGQPVLPDVQDGGPKVAVQQYLPAHPEFVVDRSCEKFLMTFFPGGWLRRVAS